MEMKPCGRCKARPRQGKHRYCLECHAAYMRKWRASHPLNKEQRRKDAARSYLHAYLRRGKIARQPCKVCGEPRVEAHHKNYSKPLEVVWLCRPHHRQEHCLS